MENISIGDLLTALLSNRDEGFGGGNGAIWLLIIIILFGGWGNNRGFGGNGGGGGAGDATGNMLYPWMNQSEQINNGFRDQMLNGTINSIAQGVTTGFSGVQQSLCSGFAGVNANLANGFNQTNIGMLQGFNNLSAQQAQCCCDNQLGMANQTATLLAEHCQDRATSTANTQLILDKLCDLELQGVKQQLDDERRANAALQNQLTMATFAASQQAQNAFIAQGFADEVDKLYERMQNCPVPSMPVYGRTPIFTCPSQNNSSGCACGGFGMAA